MKRQKAKSVKLDKNEIICSNCETILEVDEDIKGDEIIQCPNCDKIISNPFYFSGKFVLCAFCSHNGEIPKEFENHLVLNCPSCSNDIFNPHSDQYNGIICPECQTPSHVPDELFKERYLLCTTCGHDMIKNPYFIKKTPNKYISHVKDKSEDNPNVIVNEATSFENTNRKTNNNYIWIALIVLGSIILLTIGYISDSNTSSSSRSSSRSSTSVQEWYEGGTLHKASIPEWKRATDRNKLATCADFVSTYRPNFTSQQLRFAATELKNCIDEAIRGHSGFDNESVAAVGVICMTGLGFID